MATPVAPRVFKNFINGQWVVAKSGQQMQNRNPANTDEIIGVFPLSGPEDVDAAVAAAKNAYNSWRLIPAPKRAEILFRVAELLVKRKEEFSRDMTREMGKVLAETRGDVQEAIDMTYYMAGEGRRLFGQTTPSELPNKFAMSVRQLHRRMRDDHAMEFSHGDPFVEDDAGSGLRKHRGAEAGGRYSALFLHLVETMAEAGMPAGVVNLVSGDGPGTGAPLAQHKEVPVISFTGSTSTGRIIAQTCAPDFKHCSAWKWAERTSFW